MIKKILCNREVVIINRSRRPLTMNEWHTVRLERTGKLGHMVVDNQAAVHGSSSGAYTQLTLDLDLFIGGHRNYDEVNRDTGIEAGFKGCIQKVWLTMILMRILSLVNWCIQVSITRIKILKKKLNCCLLNFLVTYVDGYI